MQRRLLRFDIRLSRVGIFPLSLTFNLIIVRFKQYWQAGNEKGR